VAGDDWSGPLVAGLVGYSLATGSDRRPSRTRQLRVTEATKPKDSIESGAYVRAGGSNQRPAA